MFCSHVINVGSNPNITNFELDSLNFELTRTQVRPPKLNFEPARTCPKSPNYEPVWLKMGRTQAQIWKIRTLNRSEPRFVYQN